jgi:hypothetical protein
MTNKFDEMAKALAQAATRRQALKRFSLGMGGMALACFGLANKAAATSKTCLSIYSPCTRDGECCSGICHSLVAKTGAVDRGFATITSSRALQAGSRRPLRPCRPGRLLRPTPQGGKSVPFAQAFALVACERPIVHGYGAYLFRVRGDVARQRAG